MLRADKMRMCLIKNRLLLLRYVLALFVLRARHEVAKTGSIIFFFFFFNVTVLCGRIVPKGCGAEGPASDL